MPPWWLASPLAQALPRISHSVHPPLANSPCRVSIAEQVWSAESRGITKTIWKTPPEPFSLEYGLIFMATLRQVSSIEVCKQERGMLEGQDKKEEAAFCREIGILDQIYTKRITKKKKRQSEIQLFKITFIAGLSQKWGVRKRTKESTNWITRAQFPSLMTSKVGGCKEQPRPCTYATGTIGSACWLLKIKGTLLPGGCRGSWAPVPAARRRILHHGRWGEGAGGSPRIPRGIWLLLSL